MKLSQTLAGTWVITVQNPEEPDWETELVRFDMRIVGAGSDAEDAMYKAAASAFKAFADHFPQGDHRIASHDPEAEARMRDTVAALVMTE